MKLITHIPGAVALGQWVCAHLRRLGYSVDYSHRCKGAQRLARTDPQAL